MVIAPVATLDPPADEMTLPVLDADDGSLPNITPQAWIALAARNDPPILFHYAGGLSRIEVDERHGPVVRPLTRDALRHHLARAARFEKQGGAEVAPPLVVVRDMMVDPDPPLPVLRGITRCPCVTPHGRIVRAGYDTSSGLYYAPTSDLKIAPVVPERPTTSQIARARELWLELVVDFPFAGPAGRAHAIALGLQPFVRELIDGLTPLYAIDKPDPGTGAGLLAEVLLWPALGDDLPVMAVGKDEDEWRKRLTASLVNSPTALLIDNVKRRLESGALSAAITARAWEDRLLGYTRIVRLPVRCAWIVTGNNLLLSSELSRRAVRIALDAQTERPWLRTGFRHPDLRHWVAQRRSALVAAALTLIAAWDAAGRPEGEPVLGRFESWSRVMGGILAVAGIEGFLSDLDEQYSAVDAEAMAWAEFVNAWRAGFRTREVTVAELWPLVAQVDLGLGEDGLHSQKIRFGKRLAQSADQQRDFGGWKIVAATKRHGVQSWRLTQ